MNNTTSPEGTRDSRTFLPKLQVVIGKEYMIYVSSDLFIRRVAGSRKNHHIRKNDKDLHWNKQAILFEQNYSEIEVSGKLLTK